MAYMLLSLAAAAPCCDEKTDPGPFDIDGWIARCEDRCDQLAQCSPTQLLYDHGDLDNCKASCETRLDRDADLAFIEGSPDECLEAMYAHLSCVFDLGCEGFGKWSANADDAPCQATEADMAKACAGTATESFLDDCGYPMPPR